MRLIKRDLRDVIEPPSTTRVDTSRPTPSLKLVRASGGHPPVVENREVDVEAQPILNGWEFCAAEGKAPNPVPKYLEPWQCVPPPLIDDLGAARLLGITLDTLNRIGEEELPRLRLGRCRRYWLEDVLNYARREGSKKNFKGRAEVIGEILDDVRGRSQRRRRTSE